MVIIFIENRIFTQLSLLLLQNIFKYKSKDDVMVLKEIIGKQQKYNGER